MQLLHVKMSLIHRQVYGLALRSLTKCLPSSSVSNVSGPTSARCFSETLHDRHHSQTTQCSRSPYTTARSSWLPGCRPLHTCTHRLRQSLPPGLGYRPSTDHRGNITPGNRPDGDFVPEEEAVGVLSDSDYAALLHDASGFEAGVVGNAELSGGVFVVLPWIKWGPQQKNATTSHLMLEEACALANSLDNVTVLDKEIVKIRSESSKVFGKGQLITLNDRIKNLRGLAAVFVSIDVLSWRQLRALEKEWQVRVLDRYWLVLAVFHQHARSSEARMQVALAELAYIKSRTRVDTDRQRLSNRIRGLHAALHKLGKHREHIRNKRGKLGLPSVAVVGYTNTGKTSIISALSGNTRLQGRDQLFATLDVTAHQTKLPCGLRCLLLDTVGFIQDLPTSLIACFNATLQDAAHADVVLHVRDLSHPDRLMHHTTVMAALHAIQLPPTTPIITLDNKADLMASGDSGHRHRSEEQLKMEKILSSQTCPAATASAPLSNCVSYLDDLASNTQHYKAEAESITTFEEIEAERTPEPVVEESEQSRKERLDYLKTRYSSTPSLIVSAKTKKGLQSTMEVLQDQILRVTDRKMYRMKLPTGGQHISALRKMVGLASETVLEDTPEKTEVVVAMTPVEVAAFTRTCRAIVANAKLSES